MIPFGVSTRASSRLSFTLGTTTLQAAAPTPLSPQQIPAVGYLEGLMLDVNMVSTGGTTPAFTADAPWNVLASVELRNSSGNDLIVPVTGYQLYLYNKYGCQTVDAPYCDPRFLLSGTAPQAHMYLWIPQEISPADGFGVIPALASNRSYQLAITLAAQATVTTSNPTITVTISATAWFYTEPVASTSNGAQQQTTPPFIGSLNLYQLEGQSISPGDKLVKSNNVGNVLRFLIFVLRTAAGARTDADWPAVSELYLDNNPMFYLTQQQWRVWMAQTYGYGPNTLDALNGQDTGVYVVPFFALTEGRAIANARRSQYLPTLDASQLQIRGTSFGAAASTLEIHTNSVQPVDPATGSSSRALYAL
jgi:hypothetical protein